MNIKENVIRKEDFERYEVLLPYKVAAQNKGRKFIYSELEKMHPCFSDEYCVDSGVKKITKKGICSDVFVIHKFKLAEYENRRHFSGLGFFLADEKKKKFFVSRKIRLFIFAGIVFGFVALWGGKLALGDGKEIFERDEEVVCAVESKVSVGDEGIARPAEEQQFIGCKFLELVAANGGTLNSFSWATDFYCETIEADVDGIFPEQLSAALPAIKVPAVTYREGRPHVKFKYETRGCIGRTETFGASVNSKIIDTTELRTLLLRDQAFIKEESYNPYKVSFSCSKKDFSTVIKSLCEFVQNELTNVSQFSYNLLSDENLDVCLVINSEVPFGAGLPISILSDKKLFPYESKIEKKSSQKTREEVTSTIVESGVKIGEIRHTDSKDGNGGKVLSTVFYKMPDGKVIKKEEVLK